MSHVMDELFYDSLVIRQRSGAVHNATRKIDCQQKSTRQGPLHSSSILLCMQLLAQPGTSCR